MNTTKTQISLLLNELISKNITTSVDKTYHFYDEPRFFLYNALLQDNTIKKYSDGNPYKRHKTASGISFFSEHEALLKCLGECVERFCLLCYRKKLVISSRFSHINNDALDPSLLNGDELLRENKLGWIKGFNLTRNRECLIPAQLIYLTYKRMGSEIRLPQPNTSTGAAGGFDHESTLLRGIYEVVERDSFMTIYLNSIHTPKVNLEAIRGKKIELILESIKRYKLELHVFDITTDLGIPSFLSIVVDRTGIGPAISCGLKVNLNAKSAILGSITESFITRPWKRNELIKNKFSTTNTPFNSVTTLFKRGIFWSHPNMLRHINFLLNQEQKSISLSTFKGDKKEELDRLIELLAKKHHEVFYSDITLPMFRKINYFVYKIIIPTLQPMHFDERYKVLRVHRLLEVLRFFRKKNFRINTVPHPFI